MCDKVRNSVVGTVCVLAVFAAIVGHADDDPRRPAAIEAEGVPVVPAGLMERLAQYQNIRAAAFRGWAPAGNGILIATRFGNATQLHRVYEPGGRREQITFASEPVQGVFLPRQTDGAVLLMMDSGGNENDQVYLLDQKNYQTRLLTDGTSRNKVGAIRHDGNAILLTSNQRNGRDMDLYTADPRQANSLKLVMPVERQSWNVYDWSPSGGTALISRYVSANESYPALLDLESGMRTDLPFPTAEKASAGPMVFTADGQAILIATDAGAEFRRLMRLDLDSRVYTPLTEDIPWDVVDVTVQRESGDVAVTVNENGASGLYLFPRGTGPRKRLELPLGIVSGLEFSPNGQQLGFTLARPDAPPEAYSLDLASGDLTRWTWSEVGGLDPSAFVAPTRIEYTSFDGRKIPAYYFQPRSRPAGATRLPVYISIHGGPESQYQPFFSPILQYYVNELQLAVLCPNVRGSAGYGKSYLLLDNGDKREDSVRDIGGLLDWIAQQPELDASRVAVAGGSYGGYMTLASLTHYGDRFKAGIDVVGIANFRTFLERTAAYRVDLRRAEYGDERDPHMKEFFERISPLNHADRIKAALLVVHGKNDPRVPFFEAEQIAAKVRADGRPVWTVFANNEGHGFAKRDNSDYQRAVEVLFLRQHLQLDAPTER